MASKLVNVRLDAVRLRRARQLRARGVSLSDVVREAIDARYQALTEATAGIDAAGVVRRILEAYPDSRGEARREYDVHDPAAARRAIAARTKLRPS